jgi:hypothetical protein
MSLRRSRELRLIQIHQLPCARGGSALLLLRIGLEAMILPRMRLRARLKRRKRRRESAGLGTKGNERSTRRQWAWTTSWRWSITNTGTAAIYGVTTLSGRNQRPMRTSSTGWTMAKGKSLTCLIDHEPAWILNWCGISLARRGRSISSTSTIWAASYSPRTEYQ